MATSPDEEPKIAPAGTDCLEIALMFARVSPVFRNRMMAVVDKELPCFKDALMLSDMIKMVRAERPSAQHTDVVPAVKYMMIGMARKGFEEYAKNIISPGSRETFVAILTDVQAIARDKHFLEGKWDDTEVELDKELLNLPDTDRDETETVSEFMLNPAVSLFRTFVLARIRIRRQEYPKTPDDVGEAVHNTLRSLNIAPAQLAEMKSDVDLLYCALSTHQADQRPVWLRGGREDKMCGWDAE